MSEREDPVFLRGVLEGLPFVVCVKDPEGRSVYCNHDLELDHAEDLDGHRKETLPLALASSSDAYVLEIYQDATKLAELQKQLQHAQRMEAVGRLTGGIAHEYNNLLGIVLGYVELLVEDAEPGAPEVEDLEAIRRAAERGKDLTRQLLTFSRQEILEPCRVSPTEMVVGVRKLLERTLGEDVQVELELEECPDVWVDPGVLEQVLMNLAVNAREAMPQGGVLTLRTGGKTISGGEATLAPGVYARLVVEDTGCGMEVEELTRIFDPFYTTKPLGTGTGLGLSTVYGIVSQSGGEIRVESTPGEGTRFEVLLPSAPEGASEREDLVEPTRGEGTILVAEDEEALRKLVCRTLERAGYRVLSAADAEEARAIAADGGGTMDLLLTDVIMPHVSGVELASQLAAEYPDLRVLYMTGYSDDSALRHGLDPERAAVIRKPFASRSLLLKIEELLDGRSGD